MCCGGRAGIALFLSRCSAGGRCFRNLGVRLPPRRSPMAQMMLRLGLGGTREGVATAPALSRLSFCCNHPFSKTSVLATYPPGYLTGFSIPSISSAAKFAGRSHGFGGWLPESRVGCSEPSVCFAVVSSHFLAVLGRSTHHYWLETGYWRSVSSTADFTPVSELVFGARIWFAGRFGFTCHPPQSLKFSKRNAGSAPRAADRRWASAESRRRLAISPNMCPPGNERADLAWHG